MGTAKFQVAISEEYDVEHERPTWVVHIDDEPKVRIVEFVVFDREIDQTKYFLNSDQGSMDVDVHGVRYDSLREAIMSVLGELIPDGYPSLRIGSRVRVTASGSVTGEGYGKIFRILEPQRYVVILPADRQTLVPHKRGNVFVEAVELGTLALSFRRELSREEAYGDTR